MTDKELGENENRWLMNGPSERFYWDGLGARQWLPAETSCRGDLMGLSGQ